MLVGAKPTAGRKFYGFRVLKITFTKGKSMYLSPQNRKNFSGGYAPGPGLAKYEMQQMQHCNSCISIEGVFICICCISIEMQQIQQMQQMQ